jgi:hypothetical protein
MATQTVTIAKSESCVAVMAYDDVLLTAASITMANISGENDITFWMTVSGITQFKTVAAGASGVLVFLPTLPIIIMGGFPLPIGFNNFGIGKGVDTSVF